MDKNKDLKQLSLRHDIERFLRTLDVKIHGAGTDLTNGVMDISFDHKDIHYILELRNVNK